MVAVDVMMPTPQYRKFSQGQGISLKRRQIEEGQDSKYKHHIQVDRHDQHAKRMLRNFSKGKAFILKPEHHSGGFIFKYVKINRKLGGEGCS